MKKLVASVVTVSAILSMMGCAAVDGEPTDTEEMGKSSEALYYSMLWDVYKMENGAVTARYSGAAETLSAVQDFGLPIVIWDAGGGATSGQVYFKMSQSGPWERTYVSNFYAGASVPVGGSVIKHSFTISKGQSDGFWHSTWGQGGPWGSFGYYVTYRP